MSPDGAHRRHGKEFFTLSCILVGLRPAARGPYPVLVPPLGANTRPFGAEGFFALLTKHGGAREPQGSGLRVGHLGVASNVNFRLHG